MSTNSLVAPDTGAEPPMMDEYESWLVDQRRARTYGRLALLAGVLGAAAIGHVSLGEEHGLPFKLALAVLWGLVFGRVVEQLALGFAISRPRPPTGWLALGGLALGAVATALLYYYFVLELRALVAKDLYPRDHDEEWALGVLIAAVAGTGAFFLITKGPDQDVFHDADATGEQGAPSASARTSGSGHGIGVVKVRLALGAAAVALLVAVPFGSAQAFDWRGLQPVGLGLLLGASCWWGVMPQLAGRARRAAAAAEVKEELAAIRSANNRVWLGRLSALGAAAAVMYLGAYLFELSAERANRGLRYPQRFELGMDHGFWLLVAGVVVGLFVQKAFEPKPDIAASSAGLTGGIFDESIAHTGSIQVRQKITPMSLLFGNLGRDQYEMIDGGHAFCGNAAERSGFFARLLFGSRRAIDLVVDDLGREAIRLRRGFQWLPFFNRAQVLEGQRPVGRIDQRWSIFRRYTLSAPDGSERYELRSGLLFRSRFKVLQGGQQVGELRRVRKPWYVRMFTPFWKKDDRFLLVFPQGSGMDDRRLLVGSVFLVDITHFPTQSTVRWGALALLVLALIPGPAEEKRSFDTERTNSEGAYDD